MAAYQFAYWDIFFFYGTQIFLFVSGIFLVPYLMGRITNNPDIVRRTQIIYVLISLIGILSVFYSGIGSREESFYTTKHFVHFPGSLVVISAMVPAVLICAHELAIRVRGYMRLGEPAHGLLSILSVIVYLLVGLIDESGIITGWPLIVFRIIYLGAFLLAYSSIVSEREAAGISVDDEFIV